MKKKLLYTTGILLCLITISAWIWSDFAVKKLIRNYSKLNSAIIYDRHDEIIRIQKNAKDNYCLQEKTPTEIQQLILQKEDRYFYKHPGFNPISILTAIKDKLIYRQNRASSTITQQLTKILLNHEQDRTLNNKLIELLYAIALEIRLDKAEILEMYTNSIYLGNQIQGINLGSRYYFDKTPDNLTPNEQIQLIASISAPSYSHPFTNQNTISAQKLIKRLGVPQNKTEIQTISPKEIKQRQNIFQNFITNPAYFEYQNLPNQCTHSSLDTNLTAQIRKLVQDNLINLQSKKVNNAAVVVIKFPENKVISIVGSPEPTQTNKGYQINMAIKPRPIGSTIKPFLYAFGFSQGLRPYTLVDDREYKYTTQGGHAHYPKNYDYQYNGIVTLHTALSNSLNIPSVKVLEYIGLDNFYSFLKNNLQIKASQPLEDYQFGIALGQLEISLLELAHRFTIFAQQGDFKDLQFCKTNSPPTTLSPQVIPSQFTQLTNRILIDRNTGSSQFGLVGNIRIPNEEIAVKTGTSERYHDSWTVGYTPDFLVAVWTGNADNTETQKVSGQEGAGKIWRDTMMLLLNSQYNQNTPFNYSQIELFPHNENLEIGLQGDNFTQHQNKMLSPKLITFPHHHDEYLYKPGMIIPLKAEKEVDWYINSTFYKTARNTEYTVSDTGTIEIKAVGAKQEEIVVFVNEEQSN